MIEQVLNQLGNDRHYIVATGTAFSGNSKTGGWAAVVQLRQEGIVVHQRCVAAQEPFTTDHRMALQAAIKGLTCLKTALPAIVLSNSNYLLQGMTEWLPDWIDAKWHNSSGPVKNRDLWEELNTLHVERETLEWLSAKGHILNGLNETATAVAKEAATGVYRAGEAAIKKRHPRLFK